MTTSSLLSRPRRPALTLFILLAATLVGLLAAAPARAHGDQPDLHVGYEYKSCYIDLHPELTSGQFRNFSRQFADAGAFVSMSGAGALQAGHVALGLTLSQTFIDDAKPEWNNTFSHPGAEHWLGRPALPILMARVGLPRAFAAEVMFTGDPQSNWAIFAGALRVPVISEAAGWPVTAVARVQYMHLLGARELNLGAGTVEGLVSRSFGRFTPYASLAAVASRASEHTDELALGSTTAFGGRASAGLEVALGRFRVAGQGVWASVPVVAVMVGGVI
jgi:hypothetical protein